MLAHEWHVALQTRKMRGMSGNHQNYYQATRNLPDLSRPALQGEHQADVCIVGAGIAGCSTALHLAQRGYRVVVLEAEQVGAGASGRSGGQLLPGYSSGQHLLQQQLGDHLARQLWQWSVDAVNLCIDLIHQHHIDCDLQRGHLTAAIKARQQRALLEWQRELNRLGYADTQLLSGEQLQQRIASNRYCAALHDPHAAHVHPLNYTLGLARAAELAGAAFHEHSRVVRFTPGNTIRMETTQGHVNAKYLVLCGNAGHADLSNRLRQRLMSAGTYIIATESLGAARVEALLPGNDAVADSNFILDYFRRSADHRLLFGGRVSYSGRDFRDTAQATRRRMLKVFPQLHDARIEYTWGGLLDLSLNRAPDFGRLHPTVYYLQGFSGHGLALATLAGQLMAETLTGQSERFDVYARLRHGHFPGGPWLRTPALMLAMLWYRLRDIL